MRISEAATRAAMINPQLRSAGWDLNDRTRVRFEVPVHGYDPTPWNGYTDYSLYSPTGEVVAIIEAKKTARDPREGEEQLRIYIDEVARSQDFAPFGFMANGLRTYFWEPGIGNPRETAGFFSPDDLERLDFFRRNRKPLNEANIVPRIVNREYQHEAIRRVTEAFEAGWRRALLVMATGTGKTRVTMALIDLMFRSQWAEKVLFVADRDALVEQALTEGFKAFLPNEPRVRISTGNIDKTQRLYVATLQTMSRCFQQFTPGFFDLVVFDEAHRSIFNRYNEVIEYFDGRLVGLTATPADFIDRNTFLTFGCEDRKPTFLYTYEEAQKDKYLVPFQLFKSNTFFQREGIKGANLTEEERDLLIEQGIDPDTVNYEGTDLEETVSNKDTIRKQWELIWEECVKDQGGNLPGKTMIFALTKGHAERIREVFEDMFPEHEKAGLLQVIHYGMERVHDGAYGDGLISKFKKNDKPRIAVSVDMLDTGIDVPECVNLVFMKPVQSRIKLHQMLGRGARNQDACKHYDWLPNGEKTEFLIIDFWQNDFGMTTDERTPTETPLLVRVFNTRLNILQATLNNREGEGHQQAVASARSMIARIPKDAYPVRKRWSDAGAAWEDDFWRRLTQDKLHYLRMNVGPLLRYVPDVDVPAETFANKVERLNLEILQGKPSPELLESVAQDVADLPGFVHESSQLAESVELATSLDLADASPRQLHRLIQGLAPEMKNKRQEATPFLRIDLPDFIAGKGYVLVGPTGEQMYVTNIASWSRSESYSLQRRILPLWPSVKDASRREINLSI